MSNDPYAAPSADLQTDAAPIQTSIWNAKGRLSILSYLAQYFVLFLVFFAIFGVIGAIFGATTGFDESSLSSLDSDSPLLKIMPLVMLPLFILLFYISWCQLIKRMHDRDHVGWWSLLALIPLINIFVMIYILFFPGQKHANRYGGQRITKGWEKVVAILLIILIVVGFVGAIAAGVLSS